MLDPQFIRDNAERVKASTVAKQREGRLVDNFLELDLKWKKLLVEVEMLRKQKNEAANTKNIELGKKTKEELSTKEPELTKLENEWMRALWDIPNPATDDVKIGKDESENEIVRTWGKPAKFDFYPKDHVALGEKLGIIDIDRAVKVSGARFYYLKGDGALLQFALLNYAMEILLKNGFVPVVTPVLIKRSMMGGMGYLENGGEEDMYVLTKDDLFLTGTSEQSIGPMYSDEVVDFRNGPIRYAGFSPCFRREAGSYGKDTRGIIRAHQFYKVEMFSFTKPSDSDKEHEFLLSLEEQFLQDLELPYQVVKMCTGDLGAPASRKYDLEAWIPTQGKYRELTSTSNCTDFQSRRLNIKYQEKDERHFVHMLNGTAFSTRPIVAILENFQEKDGSVVIPKVLQKWMGKEKIEK